MPAALRYDNRMPARARPIVPGYGNFAVVIVRLDSLEWLFLAGEGHRRARFGWVTDGGLTSTWLAP